MTRDEAVIQIQRILGFHPGLVLEIRDALRHAQVELERDPDLSWFRITEVASFSTTKGEERVPVPTDFIREIEGDHLYIFDADAINDEDEWKKLTKNDLDFLRAKYPGTGEPKAYALMGDYFVIKPTPDDVYVLKQRYVAGDTPLTSNIENNWLKFYPSLLIGVAGQKVAVPTRDGEALAEFQRLESQGRDRAFRDINARQHTNRVYQMGGED